MRKKRRTRGKSWTSESGRRAAVARWSKPRESSAGDDWRRALLDAKGKPFRAITVTNHANGESVTYVIRRSLHGRADQFDLMAGNRNLMTAGLKRILSTIVHSATKAAKP